MLVRVGIFFITISLVVLFVFVASYQVDTPRYSLLLGGFVLILIGVFMIIRNRQPPEKAERFRIFRKMRSRKSKIERNTNE